jgi:predicted CXXCH cytochrome family protein
MRLARRRVLAVAAVLLALGACRAGMRPAGEGAPAASLATAAPAAPASDNPCVTSKCHATILAGKVVHDAAEGCTDCHDATSPTHPVAGQKTFGLLNDMPDLCYTCHDELGKKKTVHSPVEDGDCTECHDPHSTAEPHLLKKPMGAVCSECHENVADGKVVHGPVADGDCTSCHDPHESDTESLLVSAVPGLCTDCHTEIADSVEHAKVSHGALDAGDSCLGCHTPHASDHASLLAKSQREVCLECHDTDVPAKATVHHGKAGRGDCADCHSPHGGELEKLLVAEFPAGPYVAWTDKAYPLCFSCHDRKMVVEEETASATAFRDGKQNLHFAHVRNDEKGRSCRFCHAVHGSSNPKLIPDSVPFGKWSFSMKFVKTDSGGSCAPACHKPEAYDRDRPGRKPLRAG